MCYYVSVSNRNVFSRFLNVARDKSVDRKADLHEAWQLWIERDVVKRICFNFSICSLVFKLHEFKVAPFWKIPAHLQGSQFEKSESKFTTLGEIPCDAYS